MGRGSEWAWARNSVSCWEWGLEVPMWLGQGWGRGRDEIVGMGGDRQVTPWAGARGEGLWDSRAGPGAGPRSPEPSSAPPAGTPGCGLRGFQKTELDLCAQSGCSHPGN